MQIEDNSLNILIVEDNAGDYELLKEYLECTNLPVKNIIHATTIGNVARLVNLTNFDIVLLDLTLPDSTGVDSIITLDKLLNKTPIIVLSGMSGINIAMQAISQGAQDYLVKGEFDEKLLEKTIKYSIERKRILENLMLSNERYEFINKATMDTIWEYNFTTGVGKWGNGIINVFGYSENDIYFHNSLWKKIIHPDDFERTNKNILFNFENKIENWQDEYRLRTASGDYKYVYGRGYILFNEEGKPSRIFGAITDITDRKRLEKELVTQKLDRQKLIIETAIEAQEKERNELGKELHDNINQMLATIKIYLGMLVKNKDSNPELLTTSYNYVLEIIEEVRKLSRTLVAPSLGNTNLKDALKDLIAEVQLAKDLEVELQYSDNTLFTDDKMKLMLYRIVQEQLTNIRKHAHAKKATIIIKPLEGDLYLSMSDNGIGFDTNKKAHGIGLKNITSRVEFYAGKVDITSAPGEGCLLEIKIPV